MAIIAYEDLIPWNELLSLAKKCTVLEVQHNAAYADLQASRVSRISLSERLQVFLKIQNELFENLFQFGSELFRRRIYGRGIECFEQALSISGKETVNLFDYNFGINLTNQAVIAHESLHEIRVIIKTLLTHYCKSSKVDAEIPSAYALLIADINEYIENIVEDVEAEKECIRLSKRSKHTNLVGVSREWLLVLKDIDKYSKTDKPIFISGPPGIGKENIAEAISRLRGKKKFIAINCSAFTDELASSAMFGHKRGAFTGAVSDHKGFCEEVQDGVLFLDEIDKASLKFQAILLRLLQSKKFKVVGDHADIDKDFKGTVISAANKDMNKIIADGKFLADVYGRLVNFVITVPPLAERPADIEALITTYLSEKAPQIKAISMEAITRISNYLLDRSSGEATSCNNVRELFYLLDRIIIDAEETITTDDLPEEFANAPIRYQREYYSIPQTHSEDKFEKQDLEQLFKKTADKKEIANVFGVTLPTIYSWIKNFNVQVPAKHKNV